MSCSLDSRVKEPPGVSKVPLRESARRYIRRRRSVSGMWRRRVRDEVLDMTISRVSRVEGSDPIPRDDFLGIKLLGCHPRGYFVFYLVFEVFSSFSSRSYPPVRKRTDHCGMNMSTKFALKTRTRYFSFDQYVRKCDDSLVVNMMAKKTFHFRTEWYLLVCYCCCVKHPAHRNSKRRVYPLQCQDSGPPT